VSVAGTALFARYAYPPNELGYCGPDDASVLLASDQVAAEQRIAEHARQFEGAWSYLEIIAAAADIADPLDARVVEAYWIGNDLLDNVDPDALVAQLRGRFGDQAGASWVPGRPHHGFHVFAVYPWVGFLRRGTGNDVALSVLEQCRIRWGEVLEIDGDRVLVRARSLMLADGRLELGQPGEQIAAWSVAGRCLLPVPDAAAPVSAGDHVAMHWDWVCDVLRPDQIAQLESRTADQLARTNAGLHVAAS
jgi:Family of unknown function (DUF6390)